MSDRYDSNDYGNRLRVTPSKAYHKHWQGYVERKVILPNGHEKIERVYASPWKQHNISTKCWALLKTGYGLFTMAAILFFLFSTSQYVGSNTSKYVAIIGHPAGFSLLLLFFFSVKYIFTPRRMTLGEYRSGISNFKRVSLVSAILLLCIFVAKIIYLFAVGGHNAQNEIISAVLLLPSALFAFALNRIEHRISYVDIPNDAVQLADDTLIQ